MSYKLSLFIEDKPVVIAFDSTEQRKEYNTSLPEKQKEIESKLRVDIFNNKGFDA